MYWVMISVGIPSEVFFQWSVFWFSLQLLWKLFLSIIIIQGDITIHVHRSSCKVTVTVVTFNETWTTSTDFRKILQFQMSLKPVQWNTSWSLWTDGRTDRHDEANSCFPQFCECTYTYGKQSIYTKHAHKIRQ